MNAHTSYQIYPKAITNFINDNYGLNTINFGNIKNNVCAILQKLKIDNIIDCEWDVPLLYFFDKVNISKENNSPSDFDEYSNFKFIFKLKDNKPIKEFEKAIQIFESQFINKYQNTIEIEYQNYKQQLLIQEKKKEKLFYLFGFIIFIILIAIIFTAKEFFLKK